jgi:hypothetical protein
MPRFFFTLDDGGAMRGAEGADLPTIEAVRAEAIRFLGHALADQPDAFWSRGEWKLTVADDGGLTLFMVEVIASEAPAAVTLLREPI